jgi:hypothetical protein
VPILFPPRQKGKGREKKKDRKEIGLFLKRGIVRNTSTANGRLGKGRDEKRKPENEREREDRKKRKHPKKK